MPDREYDLDIDDESYGVITSVNRATENLPFISYCAGHYFARSKYYTVNRVLEGYLLIYTLSGRGLLTVGSREYTLMPGDMLLINCDDTPHRYQCDGKRWELLFVRFYGKGCKGYFDIICGADPTAVVPMRHPEETVFQFEKIIERSVDSDYLASTEICLALATLLTNMAASGKSTEKSSAAVRNLTSAVNIYINKNYQRRITIDDIGKEVHMSPYHLTRIFKKHTGYSLYEYVNFFRINRAAELLLNTDKRVQEISGAVGFMSVDSFIRCFKKHKSTSPGKFRRNP
ncbi:MAG: AraC family transcriptional regulator [Clostridia bacterium]|nr:AraC family transcriptional regulator [Clostridia bacterium]